MTFIVIYLHKNKQKIKKQHHVLFITAHPDDQVMFFRPSITSITKEYYTHLLCLTGAATERQEELKQSAKRLKLHKVECINNQKLKDSISQQWPVQQIQSIVLKYVSEHNIKAIFTFDEKGVSNHINHKAIDKALSQLHYPSQQLKVLNKKPQKLTQQQKQQINYIKTNTIKIYHLITVNILRKYTGFLQVFIALIREFSWVNLNLLQAYRSMKVHKSQFVWYRKLWVFFSQYSFVNVYKMTRVKININSQISNVQNKQVVHNQQGKEKKQ